MTQATDLSGEAGVEDAGRQRLHEAIERHWQDLLIAARVYVYRAGIASEGDSVEQLARELLHDAILTALRTVDRYDAAREPRPWLHGILVNTIRQAKRDLRGERQHILTIQETARLRKLSPSDDGEMLSEDEIYDRLRQVSEDALPTSRLEFDDLLALVPASDRQILRLAFEDDLRGKALADRLGIGEGAAYTRLSRSLTRFRDAYQRGSAGI